MGSGKFELNAQDITKIGKGAVIALLGALLTYLAQVLPNIDFGAWTPLIAALAAVLVNIGWKWIKDNQ